jgi:HlyD family secretion protein
VLRVIEEGGREIAAGAPILELGDPADLEVVVDVLSSDAARVAPGAEMLLVGWGGGDTLRATVRAVEPSGFTKVSPLGVEEQRVNVVADLVDPPVGLGDRYRVEARIVIWRGEQVLRVPASALWRRGDRWAVFVVERGRARGRDVRIGHRGEGWTEVVGGLAEGDRVILHPGEEVAEGVRVAPR